MRPDYNVNDTRHNEHLYSYLTKNGIDLDRIGEPDYIDLAKNIRPKVKLQHVGIQSSFKLRES